MINACRLNDQRLYSIRSREPAYAAVIIDLVLVGALGRADGERLLGYPIPDYIHLPSHAQAKVVPTPTTEPVAEEPVTHKETKSSKAAKSSIVEEPVASRYTQEVNE